MLKNILGTIFVGASFVLTLIRWGGDLDFIIERAQKPDEGIGRVLLLIADPPAYVVLACLFLGFGLLLWGQRSKAVNGSVKQEVTSPLDEGPVSAYDASKKLPIIDEAIALLDHNRSFEQPIDDAGRFLSNVVRQAQEGSADQVLQELGSLRKRFVANNQDIAAIYSKCENIHHDIAAILVQSYSNALYEGISDLSTALSKLGSRPPEDVEYWMKPQLEKFKNGIASVGRWRTTALQNLFNLRSRLANV